MFGNPDLDNGLAGDAEPGSNSKIMVYAKCFTGIWVSIPPGVLVGAIDELSDKVGRRDARNGGPG